MGACREGLTSSLWLVLTVRFSDGSFWIQDGNRDAHTRDVFGYVTTEVGMVISLDADASFAERLSACMKILTSLSTEWRNVFPEIACMHPLCESFFGSSIGINLVGQAIDTTDRNVIGKALGRNDFEMMWGRMNWIEIGNDKNGEIWFYGRADMVEFCESMLLPTLCEQVVEPA